MLTVAARATSRGRGHDDRTSGNRQRAGVAATDHLRDRWWPKRPVADEGQATIGIAFS